MIRQRVTFMLALLFLATVLSWYLGHGEGRLSLGPANAIIVLVAWFKARIIMLDFMEVRHAPRLLRLGGELWLAIVGVGLAALALMAAS